MLPRPRQRPGPPVWIGGNSRRAIRRAVELADGWSPFPNPARLATRTRTAALQTTVELADSLAYARGYADSIGRADPLSVVFIPDGLSMGSGGEMDKDRVIASIRELEADRGGLGERGPARRHQGCPTCRHRAIRDHRARRGVDALNRHDRRSPLPCHGRPAHR